MQGHDWPLDWIVTPTEAIATHTTLPRPHGLNWDAIQPAQLKQIPVLKMLAQQPTSTDNDARLAGDSTTG